ncbi:MAG: hypothetical protein MI861_07170 [Pirellulales bacterium]|nr:hypothetical protein [Pirellulales bacterium]
MATDEELDRTVTRTEELTKEIQDCQKAQDEHQRFREEFAQTFGFSPEELTANCQRVVEDMRQHGTREALQQIEEIDVSAKVEQEEALAKIDAEVKNQMRQAAGHGKQRKRLHDLV